MLAVNHKLVEDMSTRLIYARQDYVKAHQPKIQLGSTKGDFRYVKFWVDVEGDEASFTKSNMLGLDPEAAPKKPVRWEQWLGLVQRGRPESLMLERLNPPPSEVRAPGRPESLILERLNPPPSEVRAPGPGAVRKVEWLPLAKKHVQGNHIIFHTDAARSYTAKVDQVLHDNVVHAKKRKVIDGKVTWIKPNYVKVVSHKLPGTSKTVRVKAGTQLIDRAWRYMKDRIVLNQTLGAMSAAQYQYWFKNEDPWTKACDLVKFKMEKMMKTC
eukprot:s2887_g2.t1